MARIIPFKGIYYNKEKIPDLALVLTPPYDVISPEEQKGLSQRHKYNFIHIILNKEEPGDDQENNKYTRARDLLNQWLACGILKEDKYLSIYVYSHQFLYNGQQFERIGFIALLKLEEFGKGVVYPHERTLSRPKEDRLRLLKATKANTEPIFTLYEDEAKKIKDYLLLKTKTEIPFIDTEYNGQRHRLWRIHESLLISRIQEEMCGKVIYIADGHHRYETSLYFRNEQKSQMSESYNYIMAYLTDLYDESLIILPGHRLIRNLTPEELESIKKRTEDYFTVEKVSSIDMLLRRLKDNCDRHAFGLYKDGMNYLLILKEEGTLDQIKDDNPYTKRLDVTILHNLILGMELEATEAEDKINYTTSHIEAKKFVDKGEYQMAYLLNPTKIQQVREVALSGGVMPGKATYFYPKPLSGLLLNRL